jgi:hypothetical protein
MMQVNRIRQEAVMLAILVAGVLDLQATKAYSEAEERSTGWSKPRVIALPAEEGTVKGIVRIRPLPKDENDENDPLEARRPVSNIKAVFVSRKNLLWVGTSEYEHFFVVKDKIVALYPTAGADLSISIVSVPIPKSADADEALHEEMDRCFHRIAEKPLRYQYWISLRKLFGQDAFANERDPRVYSVPRISGISFDRGHAVITLAEANGRITTLTFDADLQVIAASQDGHSVPVPAPVAPHKLTTDKD